MNALYHLSIIVVKRWNNEEHKGAQTDKKFLFKLKDVLVNKSEEVFFDLEIAYLVEIVQIADK